MYSWIERENDLLLKGTEYEIGVVWMMSNKDEPEEWVSKDWISYKESIHKTKSEAQRWLLLEVVKRLQAERDFVNNLIQELRFQKP